MKELPESVLVELRVSCALLPVIAADIAAASASRAYVSESSSLGYSPLVTDIKPDEFWEATRNFERWRFKPELVLSENSGTSSRIAAGPPQLSGQSLRWSCGACAASALGRPIDPRPCSASGLSIPRPPQADETNVRLVSAATSRRA